MPRPILIIPSTVAPPTLAGRERFVAMDQTLRHALVAATPKGGLWLEGLRGSGKSALLGCWSSPRSKEQQAFAVLVQAHADRPLAQALLPVLRQVLLRLPPAPSVQAGLELLAGLRLAHAPHLPLPAGDPAPRPGLADSGNLEGRLSAAINGLGQALRQAGRACMLYVDDAHAWDRAELQHCLRAQATVLQRGWPLGLSLAGLPFLRKPDVQRADPGGADLPLRKPGSAGSRRLRPGRPGPRPGPGPPLGCRRPGGAGAPLQGPARAAAGLVPPDLGAGAHQTLSSAQLRQATPAVWMELDRGFYGPGFERLAPREKNYLRSMAHLGPGPHRSGDIADSMDAKITALGPLQRIREGWIYSPGHGRLGFCAPGMDEFLRRAMPNSRRPYCTRRDADCRRWPPHHPSMTRMICTSPTRDTVVMAWNMAPFKPVVGTSMALPSCTAGFTLK